MPHHLQSQGVLTGARQTMTAWSRVIEVREDIPTFYKRSFDEHVGGGQPFPHVVLTPALDKFRRRTTEKLVVDTDEAIHIFERDRNQLHVRCYPYRDICAVEVGSVLLESWLTVHGKTSEGEAGSATIELNTTSLYHFDGVLKKLRPSFRSVDSAQAAVEKDKFDCLSAVNFKFMNYGRQSLVPGETVLQFLLQPEIRQPVLTVFGRTFYKTLAPAHLTILTDQELILIRSDERGRTSRADRYGGIWQFIPLRSLVSVAISKPADGRLTLSIHYQPGHTVERLFDISNKPQLEQACSRLQTLIGQARMTSL